MSRHNKALRHIAEHAIVFVLLVGGFTIFFWVRSIILGFDSDFNWGGHLIIGGIIFLVITVVFEVKKYLKTKEMTEHISILSADEKLAMLKALRDNNILTQEEYEHKKEKI